MLQKAKRTLLQSGRALHFWWTHRTSGARKLWYTLDWHLKNKCPSMPFRMERQTDFGNYATLISGEKILCSIQSLRVVADACLWCVRCSPLHSYSERWRVLSRRRKQIQI